MADKQISQLVAATTIENDDLFVMQQGGTAKKLSGQKLADFVYQSAANQIERVNEAVEQTQAAVDALEEQKNEIAQTIADMAQLGTDTTLTTPGMAADAAATGEVKDIALARFEQAEITGVPIATFDDGADDAPVKALKIAIEPKQDLHGYDKPWPAGGGKNLIDPSKRTEQSGTIDRWYYDDGFTLTANTSYFVTSSKGTSAAVYIIDKTSGSSIATGDTGSIIYTPAEDVVVFFRVYTSSGVHTTDLMVAISSTVILFEPYSNICPITGWTGAKVFRTGRNLFDPSTAVTGSYITTPNGELIERSNSGKAHSSIIRAKPSTTYFMSGYAGSSFYSVISINSKGYATSLTSSGSKTAPFVLTLPADSKYVYLNFDADQVNTMSFYESDNTGEYIPYTGTTYSITFPNEAGTVYGGSLDVKNGVLTVDRVSSTYTWSDFSNQTPRETGYVSRNKLLTDMSTVPEKQQDVAKCSIGYYSQGSGAFAHFNTTTNKYFQLFMPEDTPENLEFNILYLLETPVTYTLTPIEVKTFLALNNIWADTGNINDLIYRKMPIPVEELENTIESMIAGVEHTMEATQNYTEGDLVIAVHKLYHIDSNIASGETLVPGGNCSVTTIEAELASLKTSVNNLNLALGSLGNLATLNYQVVT